MIRRYFSRSISSKINLPFAVVFLFVLAGLMLFATSSRYTFSQMEDFHEQLEHVFLVNQIHASAYGLILSAHHFLLTKEPNFLSTFNNTLDELSDQTSGYINMEKKQSYEEAREEIAWIKEIQSDVNSIRSTSDELFQIFSTSGAVDSGLMSKLESLAYSVEFKVEQVNNLHSKRSSQLINTSKARVAFLGRIFLVFILLGFILLLLVNMIIMRHVVKPLKKLAGATTDLAGGDLRRRVDLHSDDEVGALAKSFNEMAERLEEHDREHHEFSTKLEQMVKERTRELEQTTENLRTTQDRLIRSEKQAMVGRLAAGVAHEVRTPLNSLAINFQILQRQLRESIEPTTSSVAESLSVIDMELSRINRVLEEFVSYARFPEPDLRSTDINELIREVVQFMTPEAEEHRVGFELQLPPVLAQIEVDEEQVRQLLINLCINAIQAMDNGGSITLSTESVEKAKGLGEGVVIRVADQGIGITAEALEGIFEPFYSTKPDGLGLGLAIVSRIVDQHNGRISCQSRLGQGTTFEVFFPRSFDRTSLDLSRDTL